MAVVVWDPTCAAVGLDIRVNSVRSSPAAIPYVSTADGVSTVVMATAVCVQTVTMATDVKEGQQISLCEDRKLPYFAIFILFCHVRNYSILSYSIRYILFYYCSNLFYDIPICFIPFFSIIYSFALFFYFLYHILFCFILL